ncbi:MAG: histidine kinase [Flavobacterium sp.]|uniref:sensor histidine kinase n=1 Tax=Flavobacterium sp. TaxID=239 RepID=UPI003263C994
MELALGQNPYYTTIDNTSGLPSNSIYDVFQDSKGFMWFASGKGICKYDGNIIKTYTADFQTSKSGSCIQEDKYGRIWYENFDGFLYYIQNEKIKALAQNMPLGYFRYGIINNYLLVLETDAVQFYDLKTLKPTKKVSLKFSNLNFVFCTEDKLYVFDDKLYEIDESGNTKSYFFPANFKAEFNAPIVQNTRKGIVIISKYTNNYCYFENGKFIKRKFNFPTEFIQNLATPNDNLWLCTTKGIILVDSKTNQSTTYFSDKNISFIYKDKQHNYWVSTINEGVYFIENFDTKIIELPSKPIVITKSGNDILVGLENDAVIKIDPKTYYCSGIYKGNLNHDVYQLFYDANSNTTFLTSSHFKLIANQKTKELGVGAVKSVTRIDAKYFSYAASNASGVFTIDNGLKSDWNNVIKKYKSTVTENVTHSNLVTNCNGKSTAYNPENQTIYYATNNGLIAFSKKKQNEIKYNKTTIYFTKLYYYNKAIYGFSSNEKIYSISTRNEIKLYDLPKAIANEKIDRIDLENNSLFVFINNAVYEINIDTNAFKKIITVTKDNEITDITLLDNQFYFASSKGIIVKKNNSNKTIHLPKLFINEISVNDEKQITKKDNILKFDENNIKINFTVLSFVPNEKFSVLYSINNSKWNVLDTDNRNLILSSLSPNEYEIRLKINAKNCSKIQYINFIIKKPIWLNPFVLLFLSIIFFLLLYTLYKFQISKIQKKNKLALDKINLEKNLNQSKLKAIKSQMNPHFFYNALNTLQSYILSNEKKQAIEYLSKFSNLTRTILEMTEKETISINEEIKTLKLYLDIEKARFEDDFTYIIILKSEIEAENIKIPSMLLQPYVENAIKHGLLHKQGKKELKITFELNNDLLQISIDDNGIGRQKSAELNTIKNKNHNSFATEAMQNRINLLNQYTHKNISIDFIDKTNPLEQALGTTVIFKIPISY